MEEEVKFAAGPPAPLDLDRASPKQKQTRKKKSRMGRLPSEITREELAQWFHLPAEEAARVMRVSLTVLKRVARRHGVLRWPYRKVKSLTRAMNQRQQHEQYVLQQHDQQEQPQQQPQQQQPGAAPSQPGSPRSAANLADLLGSVPQLGTQGQLALPQQQQPVAAAGWEKQQQPQPHQVPPHSQAQQKPLTAALPPQLSVAHLHGLASQQQQQQQQWGSQQQPHGQVHVEPLPARWVPPRAAAAAASTASHGSRLWDPALAAPQHYTPQPEQAPYQPQQQQQQHYYQQQPCPQQQQQQHPHQQPYQHQQAQPYLSHHHPTGGAPASPRSTVTRLLPDTLSQLAALQQQYALQKQEEERRQQLLQLLQQQLQQLPPLLPELAAFRAACQAGALGQSDGCPADAPPDSAAVTPTSADTRGIEVLLSAIEREAQLDAAATSAPARAAGAASEGVAVLARRAGSGAGAEVQQGVPAVAAGAGAGEEEGAGQLVSVGSEGGSAGSSTNPLQAQQADGAALAAAVAAIGSNEPSPALVPTALCGAAGLAEEHSAAAAAAAAAPPAGQQPAVAAAGPAAPSAVLRPAGGEQPGKGPLEQELSLQNLLHKQAAVAGTQVPPAAAAAPEEDLQRLPTLDWHAVVAATGAAGCGAGDAGGHAPNAQQESVAAAAAAAAAGGADFSFGKAAAAAAGAGSTHIPAELAAPLRLATAVGAKRPGAASPAAGSPSKRQHAAASQAAAPAAPQPGASGLEASLPSLLALLRQAAGAQQQARVQAQAQGPQADFGGLQLLSMLLSGGGGVGGEHAAGAAALPPPATALTGSGAWQEPAGGPPHAALPPPQQQPAAAAGTGIEALLARLLSGQPVLQQHSQQQQQPQPQQPAFQAPQPPQQQLPPALQQLQQQFLQQQRRQQSLPQQPQAQQPPQQHPLPHQPHPQQGGQAPVPKQVALLRLQQYASQLGYSLGTSSSLPPASAHASLPNQQWLQQAHKQ